MPSAKSKVSISIDRNVYEMVKTSAVLWARRNHLSEERIVTKYIESLLKSGAEQEKDRGDKPRLDIDLKRKADLAYESFLMGSDR